VSGILRTNVGQYPQVQELPGILDYIKDEETLIRAN